MGLMDQLKQRKQQLPQANQPAGAPAFLRQLIGNQDPQALIDQLIKQGATCNFPNGKTISVADLVNMSANKTVGQLLEELSIH